MDVDTEKSRLERKLAHYVRKAIHDFRMLEGGERVMVCLSGGKDSHTLLKILAIINKRQKRPYHLFAFTLDQSQPGWDDAALRTYLENEHFPYTILKRDTYSIVKEKIPLGKTYCSLCSRLRRGNIYRFASEHGFVKIALGHHREDAIHTLLMSMLYAGELRSMPPKLLTDNKQHIVIRPLIYCQEKDIARYAQLMRFPIIPCNLCGSQENLARQKVAAWVAMLSKDNPKVPSNLLHALQNISPSQLMDHRYWDFRQLEQKRVLCYNEKRPNHGSDEEASCQVQEDVFETLF